MHVRLADLVQSLQAGWFGLRTYFYIAKWGAILWRWPGMGFFFYQYQGCWIQGIISFHRNFHAKATDLLLCTLPKSGTTWLKALAFSIVNRDHYAPARTPLLTSSPHALVPCCEFDLFENDQNSINLDGLESPRIFATHASYNYDFVVKIEYKRRA